MLAEAFQGKKIVIACGRTDLRKSIDGLAQYHLLEDQCEQCESTGSTTAVGKGTA